MRVSHQYLSSIGLALADQIIVREVYNHDRSAIHWQHHIWFGTVSTEYALLAAIALFFAVLSVVPRSLGTALLAAGILSNGISYLLYSGIPDYLQVPGFYTNIADIMIVGGIVVLGLEILMDTKKTRG